MTPKQLHPPNLTPAWVVEHGAQLHTQEEALFSFSTGWKMSFPGATAGLCLLETPSALASPCRQFGCSERVSQQFQLIIHLHFNRLMKTQKLMVTQESTDNWWCRIWECWELPLRELWRLLFMYSSEGSDVCVSSFKESTWMWWYSRSSLSLFIRQVLSSWHMLQELTPNPGICFLIRNQAVLCTHCRCPCLHILSDKLAFTYSIWISVSWPSK